MKNEIIENGNKITVNGVQIIAGANSYSKDSKEYEALEIYVKSKQDENKPKGLTERQIEEAEQKRRERANELERDNEIFKYVEETGDTNKHKNPYSDDRVKWIEFNRDFQIAKDRWGLKKREQDIQEHAKNFKREIKLLHLIHDCERNNSANSETDLRAFANALTEATKEENYSIDEKLTAIFFFTQKQNVNLK